MSILFFLIQQMVQTLASTALTQTLHSRAPSATTTIAIKPIGPALVLGCLSSWGPLGLTLGFNHVRGQCLHPQAPRVVVDALPIFLFPTVPGRNTPARVPISSRLRHLYNLQIHKGAPCHRHAQMLCAVVAAAPPHPPPCHDLLR